MSENEPEAPEAPEAPKEEPQYIDFDQFAAVELKAGKVMEAALHPDADRLPARTGSRRRWSAALSWWSRT